MKKCPFCAEEIQDEAVKCRFCQSDLRPVAGQPGKPPPEVVCAYCGTRNRVGGRNCRSCGKVLASRGLQYTGGTPVPVKRAGCITQLSSLGWALFWVVLIFAVVIFVMKTYGLP